MMELTTMGHTKGPPLGRARLSLGMLGNKDQEEQMFAG